MTIPEGTKLLITIDRHDFVIQVVGTRFLPDGSLLPQTVILEHSKACAEVHSAGATDGHGRVIPLYLKTPEDYKVPA